MCDQLWFFSENGNVNLGSKPSLLASFVILTRSQTTRPWSELVRDQDFKYMGYSGVNDLMADPNHPSKIRIYIRKKYGDELP